MKILLVGNKGLIGSAIESTLIDNKLDFHNFIRNKKSLVKENIDSLRSEHGSNSFDICINCAGQSKVWYSWNEPQEDLLSNVLLQIELIKSNLIKENGHFIYFGSDSIFSTSTDLGKKSSIDLDSPYSISKFAGETYTKVLSKKLGYSFSIFRPSFVVGKSFSRNILFDSIQASSGLREFPKIHPDSSFNFIDVNNLSDYIVNLIISGELKEFESLASKNNTTYADILDYYKVLKDEYLQYNLINRCLINDSEFDHFFDLHSFLKHF